MTSSIVLPLVSGTLKYVKSQNEPLMAVKTKKVYGSNKLLSGRKSKPMRKTAKKLTPRHSDWAIPLALMANNSATMNHGMEPGPDAKKMMKVMTAKTEVYCNAAY